MFTKPIVMKHFGATRPTLALIASQLPSLMSLLRGIVLGYRFGSPPYRYRLFARSVSHNNGNPSQGFGARSCGNPVQLTRCAVVIRSGLTRHTVLNLLSLVGISYR